MPVSSENVSERVQEETWIDGRIRVNADWMSESVTIRAVMGSDSPHLTGRKTPTFKNTRNRRKASQIGLLSEQKNPCDRSKLTIVHAKNFRLDS